MCGAPQNRFDTCRRRTRISATSFALGLKSEAMMWRISRSNSIIKWQGYRVSASRLAESNFRHTQLSLLCCVTPVLAVLLGALGLTAFVAKLDYVLVPVFVASVALVIFAVVRRRWGCAAKTP